MCLPTGRSEIKTFISALIGGVHDQLFTNFVAKFLTILIYPMHCSIIVQVETLIRVSSLLALLFVRRQPINSNRMSVKHINISMVLVLAIAFKLIVVFSMFVSDVVAIIPGNRVLRHRCFDLFFFLFVLRPPLFSLYVACVFSFIASCFISYSMKFRCVDSNRYRPTRTRIDLSPGSTFHTIPDFWASLGFARFQRHSSTR